MDCKADREAAKRFTDELMTVRYEYRRQVRRIVKTAFACHIGVHVLVKSRFEDDSARQKMPSSFPESEGFVHIHSVAERHKVPADHIAVDYEDLV